MPLLRFQRCLAAFLFPPFCSYLAKKAENKSSQDFLSPTVSTYLHGEQRGRGLETRPAPLHRHSDHHHNRNSNCNTISSARCARSGLPTVSSCLYGEQPGDAELATLVSAPCSPYRTKPQPKLKPQLKIKLQLHLLRSLRSRPAYGLLMPVWRAAGGR